MKVVAVLNEAISERFWEKVSKTEDPNECWNWNASGHPTGYGLFWLAGTTQRAHRVAWLLTNGEIPDDLLVCHNCDNPACCNPKHLFLGTQKMNRADCKDKGRVAVGDRHGSFTHPEKRVKGERHKHHKLTEQQVREMRNTYAAGGTSFEMLGELYGVTKQTAWRIVRFIAWRHVA